MAMPAGTSTVECFQQHQQEANEAHQQSAPESAETSQCSQQTATKQPQPVQHHAGATALAPVIFPPWLDQQNVTAPFGFGMPELPLATASSMTAAFDYGCGNGMGMLPPGYPTPPTALHEGQHAQQQSQQQDASQLFMGGLYDSLAAAAALASAPGNFWAGADFYGSAAHWQHWQGSGYSQPICHDQTTAAAYFGQAGGFEIYTGEGLAAGYGQLGNAVAAGQQQQQTDWQQHTIAGMATIPASGQATTSSRSTVSNSGGTKRNAGGGGQKGCCF